MLDEDKTAGLYSFNNNNNANFPLYICNIHFELTVLEQQQLTVVALSLPVRTHRKKHF